MRITRKMLAVPVAAATLLVSAGGASAARPDVQIIAEKDLSVFVLANDCAEDIHLIDGFFRIVVRTSPDGTIKREAFLHLVGTGTSGTKYISNQPLQASISDTEFSGRSTAVLMSSGPQPNEIIFFRWYFSANLDSVEIFCRG